MALKVEIYQKENVKPISPTPASLRTYKLSLLDQVIGTFYMPVVFFYGSGAGSRSHDFDQLKESLSKSLSVLYPLAGRQKDAFTIDCNDEGADFFRANVTNCDLGDFISHPKLDLLRQLFPRDPYPTAYDPSQPLLAVQVNTFQHGGTAVAICLWHGLADASGLAGLLQTWAGFNRGVGLTNHEGSFIVNSTAIFKPINFDISGKISASVERRKLNRGHYIAKRFIFHKQEIERLKDELTRSENLCRSPTRVEAMSAFIWAAVIRATLQDNPNLKTHMLTNSVDLRKRMNPPFPSTCLRNINHLTAARWVVGGAGVVTAMSLIRSVQEAFMKMTHDYVKKMHVDGGYLKAITTEGKVATGESEESRILSMSSWFKFEFLKIDFGWGKPIWFGHGNNLEDLVLLLDGADGGIEVWIGLPRQIMYHLDNDTEFTSRLLLSQVV